MVVKMVKWRAALLSRKFEARLVVKGLEGLGLEKEGRLRAEIKWKGSKIIGGLGSLRGAKRDKTNVGVFGDDGVLQWNEEFRNFCSLLGLKDNGLCSWEVVINVLTACYFEVTVEWLVRFSLDDVDHVLHSLIPDVSYNNLHFRDSKDKAIVVGTASLNLSEYVSASQVKEVDISIPLTLADRSMGSSPLLVMSVSLMEVKCGKDEVDLVCGSVGDGSALSSKSALPPRSGRKKVNLFKGCVTAPRLEMENLKDENNDGKFDSNTDSVEDLHEEEFSDEGKDETNMLQPLSYGPLTLVNIGHSRATYSTDIDDWIYDSNHKPQVVSSYADNLSQSVEDPSVREIPKHRFLTWRRRKLRFKSKRTKGEPLLKKDCRDEGGDDIDFDRRQLTSSDESSFGWRKTEDGSTTSRSSFSEFEDEGFCVGAWEQKDITCRDGHVKLETQVFFASMDQRSERAAGESACTALVAVIAEWFQSNRCEMPIRSEFDRLIKYGSSEWRNMCDNQAYMERFPDKHFDLETVLDAKIRPLSVNPDKSFIGFFHPEGIAEESCFDILRGSMSFDEIWDEISRQASEANTSSSPLVYIVSWNDHFFILKVDQDAYYVIDTLGERLYEGCNQAYILKFDQDTKIKQIPNEADTSGETIPDKSLRVSRNNKSDTNLEDSLASDEKSVLEEFQGEALMNKTNADGGLVLVSSGKESCKEYIKSFLTAIPIRQLQEDIKKGSTSIPLHQRLQIEFHFTDLM